jgi:hypothetical protein
MSLDLLVSRFDTFIRESHPTQDRDNPGGPAGEAFPDELAHLREAVSHHLIPLVLLARADREFSPLERDVIVAHCSKVASRQGLEIGGAHTAILSDYISSFAPTTAQLNPALHRLARCSHDEIVELVGAAKAVVEADGLHRVPEVKFFEALSNDLASLKTAP